jgi:small-conductance mechanosensitive channel
VVNGLLLVVVAYQVVMALHTLIDYAFQKRAEREGKDAKDTFQFLGNFIKWILWAVAILMVLGNLGVNVTSLIAGLGIGGIAIALALQNILSDLFSSFAIYLDKPFEVGDFVTIGANSGTVERIGIKTTRLRALQGEEIVISNQELTATRIQNFKKMHERRISFSFGVVYDTAAEKVRTIPDLVADIFSPLNGKARFERAHFKNLADSALEFEVVYYVPSRDFTDYMNLQQEINLALLERFEKEKISFAYPTQTIHLEK